MFADVRKWGNSLAIRIPKEEAEAMGLREGSKVKVLLRPVPEPGGKVDVSHAPFFRDPEGRRDISEKHDEILYGRERRRRSE